MTLDGREEKCQQRKIGPYTYECVYTPQQAGPHTVDVRYGGDHIMLSPFKVTWLLLCEAYLFSLWVEIYVGIYIHNELVHIG